MNKKIIGIAIALLTAVMVIAPLIGATTAKNVKIKEKDVSYELDVLYSHAEVTYVDSSGYPELVIVEEFHPIGSIIYLTVTIDDIVYSYPDDFDYSDFWHAELNYNTLEGILEVEWVLTFNLPGNPTIIGRPITTVWNFGTSDVNLAGTVTLTGTGLFDKVKGYAVDEGWDVGGNFYVHHVGVLKGWPL